jgi:DNA-binding beta-propeller fold protein YncE
VLPGSTVFHQAERGTFVSTFLLNFRKKTKKLFPAITPPDSPQGLSVIPFGKALYVVNNNAGTVKVITIADDTVSDTVFLVGNGPVDFGKFFFQKPPWICPRPLLVTGLLI